MRRLPGTLVGFVLLVSAGVAAAEAPSLPKPSRYVTDRAAVLPAPRAAALNEKLAEFERQSSDQILVYVDRRVPEGTTLEELGAKSIREWGVGQKEKSNGLIFFVFTDDRKMRVEVGYGLEGAIPDARAHRITDEIVKPSFRSGDFAGGIEAGVDALLSAARGEPFAGTGRTVAEAGRKRGTGPSPVFIALAVGFLGFWGLMAFFIVRGIRRSGPATGAGRSRGGWTTGSGAWSASSLSSSGSSSGWSSSSSSSSSDSSSSSSSDFSGGGGDGGGGGSSDSW